MVMALELRLHSPAGTEPNVYKWPLTSGRGAVRNVIVQMLYFINELNMYHECDIHAMCVKHPSQFNKKSLFFRRTKLMVP